MNPTHKKISGTDAVLKIQTKLLNKIDRLNNAFRKIMYIEQIGTRAGGFDTASYKIAKKALLGEGE